MPKKQSGNRTHTWSDEDVRAVAALRAAGVADDRICVLMLVDKDTLWAKFGKRHEAKARPFTEAETKVAETMAAMGIKHSAIARCLGSTVTRLKHLLGHRLEIAQAKATARVAGALFEAAVKRGDVTAQKFWLSTRGGDAWKQTAHVHIEGSTGILVAPGHKTTEQWVAAEAQRTRAMRGETADDKPAEPEFLARSASGRKLPWDAEADDEVVDVAWKPTFTTGEDHLDDTLDEYEMDEETESLLESLTGG